MSRVVVGLKNFVSGILSSYLLCRDDLTQFIQGLRISRNFHVTPYGPLTRRTGTRFVASVKDPTKRVRFFSFQASAQEAYILEVGDLYMRFFAKSGVVLSGGVPLEISTPWTSDDLMLIQVAQTADVMYMVHPNHAAQKLVRTTATSFSLTSVTFSNGRAPMGPLNVDPTKYPTTMSGTWPNITITMSASTFVPGDVGRYFYVRNATAKNSWYLQITGYTSATVVTATGLDRFNTSGTNPQGADGDRWAMSVMSATSGCSAVAFHEGRLWYGGFQLYPTMIWASVSDDYDNFEFESPDPSTADSANADRAIQRQTLSAGSQANLVRWIAGVADRLVIGCSAGEFVIQPDQDNILTPTTSSIKRQTTRGSSSLPPVAIDSAIYFLQRCATRLRQFVYDAIRGSYNSKDITILADHLIRGGDGILGMVYQQEPYSTLWAWRADGQLVGWTIDTDQGVVGAHTHLLGGSTTGGNAIVESAAVIPGEFVVTPKTPLTGLTGSITSSITNPAAESGSTTGWTATAGSWSAVTSLGGISPQAGSYFFSTSTVDPSELTQAVDLGAVGGINLTMIDQGLTTVSFSVYLASSVGGFFDASVTAYSATGEELGVVYQLTRDNPEQWGSVLGWRPHVEDTWELIQANNRPVPPLTRTLTIRLMTNPVGATDVAVSGHCFDTVALSVSQVDSADTSPFIQSEDQLWLAVRRTINGATTRYVEILTPSFQPALEPDAPASDLIDPLDDAFFVDCGLTYRQPVHVTFVSTSASADLTTDTAHGLATGDIVRLRGLAGPMGTYLNQRRFHVTLLTATSVTLADPTTGAPISTIGYTFLPNTDGSVDKEVSSVTGLDHLTGEAVSILADGSPQADQIVRGGKIALDPPASIVHAGLPYTSHMETMPLVGVGRRGSDQGRGRQIGPTILAVMNTLGGRFGLGTSPTKYTPLVYRTGSTVTDRSPPLKTGVVRLTAEGRHNDDWSTIVVEQTQPLPMTILGVFPDVDVSEA